MGLSVQDAGVRTSVLDTLFTVAKDDSAQRTALAEHASTLVTTLLRNVLPEEITSTVRVHQQAYDAEWLNAG